MKLKKFKQFLNESNEIENDEINTEYDNPSDLKTVLGDDNLGEEDYDLEDGDDIDDIEGDEDLDLDVDIDDIEGDEDLDTEFGGDRFSDNSFEGEEEEGHEYNGNILMQELADKLGEDVVNNQINYNGKVINYYSETEKFHIGRDKFSSVEEVIEFLGGASLDEPIDSDLDEPIDIDTIEESRRYIKRF